MNLSINQSTRTAMADTPARKFLFDRSFDDGLPPETTEPEAPKPVYTEDQMNAAREEAYQSGLAAGRQITAGEQQAQMDQLVMQIGQKLKALAADSANEWQRQLAQLQGLAVAIVRKILPDYASKHGLQEIQSVLSQVIRDMAREPRLVVRIHETHFDYISGKIKELSDQAAYPGKVVVLAESELGPADCRIEWADGGIERDMKTLWHEIDNVLARAAVPSKSTEPGNPGVQS